MEPGDRTVGVGAVVLVPRLHDDGVGPLQHNTKGDEVRGQHTHAASVPRHTVPFTRQKRP